MPAPPAPPAAPPVDASAEVREFRSERWLALSSLPGDRAFRSFSVAPRASPKSGDSTLRAPRSRHAAYVPPARRAPLAAAAPPAGAAVAVGAAGAAGAPGAPRARPQRRARFAFRRRGRLGAARTGPRDVSSRDEPRARAPPRADRADPTGKAAAAGALREPLPPPTPPDAPDAAPPVRAANSSPSLSGAVARAPLDTRRRIRSGFGFRRAAASPPPPDIARRQHSAGPARAPPSARAVPSPPPPAGPSSDEPPRVRRSVSAPSLDRSMDFDGRADAWGGGAGGGAVGGGGGAGARRLPLAFRKRRQGDAGFLPEDPVFTYAEAAGGDGGGARRLLSRFGLRRAPKYDAFNPDPEHSGSIPWQSPMPKMRSEPDLSDAKPPPPATPPDDDRPAALRFLFGARRARDPHAPDKQLEIRARPRHASLPVRAPRPLDPDDPPPPHSPPPPDDPAAARRSLFPFGARKAARADPAPAPPPPPPDPPAALPAPPPPDRADPADRALAEQVNADLAAFSSLQNALSALSSGRAPGGTAGALDDGDNDADLLEPITPERSTDTSLGAPRSGSGVRAGDAGRAEDAPAPAKPGFDAGLVDAGHADMSAEELALANAFSGPVLVFSHPPPGAVALSPGPAPEPLAHRLISKLSGGSSDPSVRAPGSSDEGPDLPGIRRALSSMSSSPDPTAEGTLAQQLLAAQDAPRRMRSEPIGMSSARAPPPRPGPPSPETIDAPPAHRGGHAEQVARPKRSWLRQKQRALTPPPLHGASAEQPAQEFPEPATAPQKGQAQLPPMDVILASPWRKQSAEGAASPNSASDRRSSVLFKPFSSGTMSTEISPGNARGALAEQQGVAVADGKGSVPACDFETESWQVEPSSLEQQHLEHSDAETVYEDEPPSAAYRRTGDGQRAELQTFLKQTWKKAVTDKEALSRTAPPAVPDAPVTVALEKLKDPAADIEGVTRVPSELVVAGGSVDELPLRAPSFRDLVLTPRVSASPLPAVPEQAGPASAKEAEDPNLPFFTPVASPSPLPSLSHQVSEPSLSDLAKRLEERLRAKLGPDMGQSQSKAPVDAQATSTEDGPEELPSTAVRDVLKDTVSLSEDEASAESSAKDKPLNLEEAMHTECEAVLVTAATVTPTVTTDVTAKVPRQSVPLTGADRKSAVVPKTRPVGRDASFEAYQASILPPTMETSFEDILEARRRLKPSSRRRSIPRSQTLQSVPSTGNLIDDATPSMKDLISLFGSGFDSFESSPLPANEQALPTHSVREFSSSEKVHTSPSVEVPSKGKENPAADCVESPAVLDDVDVSTVEAVEDKSPVESGVTSSNPPSSEDVSAPHSELSLQMRDLSEAFASKSTLAEESADVAANTDMIEDMSKANEAAESTQAPLLPESLPEVAATREPSPVHKVSEQSEPEQDIKSPGSAHVEAVSAEESTVGENAGEIGSIPDGSKPEEGQHTSALPSLTTERAEPPPDPFNVASRLGTIRIGTLRNHISVPSKVISPPFLLDTVCEGDPAKSPEEAESPSLQHLMALPGVSKSSSEERQKMRRSLFQEFPPISSQRVLAEGEMIAQAQSPDNSDMPQRIHEPAEWKNMGNNSKLSLGFSDLAERVESMQSVVSEHWGHDSGDSSQTFPSMSPSAPTVSISPKSSTEEVSRAVPELASEKDDPVVRPRTAQRLPLSLPRVDSQGSVTSSEDLDASDNDSTRQAPLSIAPPSVTAEVEEVAPTRKLSSGTLDESRVESSSALHRFPKPLEPLRRSKDSPRSSDAGFSGMGHSTFSAPTLGRRPRPFGPPTSALHTSPLDLSSHIFEVGSSSDQSVTSTESPESSPGGVQGTLSMPSLGRQADKIQRPYSARRRTKHSQGAAAKSPSGSFGDLSRDRSASAPAAELPRSESQVRAAMSTPAIMDAGKATRAGDGGPDAPGRRAARSASLLTMRRHRSLGLRRARQDASAPARSGGPTVLSSGQLRARRTFSMRARRANAIEEMAAERDLLAEAVRRERASKAAVVAEVASLENAARNSKIAADTGELRIRELRAELEALYDECPRLERRLPEIKDGFLYKETALASAIRLWVDQTGGIGIDWTHDMEDEVGPVDIKNLSPYRGGV